MPLRLIWKLLIINALSLGMILVLIAVAVHWLASSYFMTLMEQYHIDPAETNRMFLQAVDRYLIGAGGFGFAVAIGMSYWLNYRLVAPILQLVRSARLISAGDFAAKVEVHGCGELDDLCNSFNQMAADLRQLDQLRKNFIVDVAHELRTPLTNIRGYMEALQDRVMEPDPEVIESILEETMRLAQLVEELLELARADVAKHHLNFERFDFWDHIRQSIDRFRPRFEGKAMVIQFVGDGPGWITADADRITQVLTNLFENALRYSPHGGRVILSSSKQGDQVRFVIVNDCEHIPEHDAKLFERFQRGENSRSREHGGAGLGLAIVKELVHAHAGKVGNRFYDGKAEFWFDLPRDR